MDRLPRSDWRVPVIGLVLLCLAWFAVANLPVFAGQGERACAATGQQCEQGGVDLRAPRP